MTDPRRAVLFALPGLLLAVAGLFHPHALTHETAPRWTLLHVAGLVVFPLVGVALAALVRGRREPVAWLAVLTAYLYSTAYTALDVISGIGAGWVTWQLGEGVARPDEVRFLFVIGGRIGDVGSLALIACSALITADAVRRLGARGLSGLALVLGAYLVHADHIFAPTGAAGMVLIALGTGLLAVTGERDAAQPATARRRAPTARRRPRGSRGGRG